MGEARLRALAAAAVLTLAGCADRLAVDASGARTALPPASATAKPGPEAAPAAAAPPARAPADACGAVDLAYLVGKPRTEIPVPVDLTRRRVVCEGCPITLDVRPDRQTVWYDQATGKVTRATCG